MNTNRFIDAEIITRVLEGDVDLFETLLTRHKDLVLSIAKKHVPYSQVEEVAHEVFIRAYQSLPMFKGKSVFKHWLSSIAVKTCYDFWRKHYKKREFSMSSLTQKHQDWLEQVLSSEATVSEKAREKEAGELLDWALGKLSAEDRVAMELVYLDELSEKEAASLLGWSLANVKIRTFRSRRKLRKILARIVEK